MLFTLLPTVVLPLLATAPPPGGGLASDDAACDSDGSMIHLPHAGFSAKGGLLGGVAARAEKKCDYGERSALTDWETFLIEDFPAQNTSTNGRLCFDTTQGVEDEYAQALWIISMKVLSNFNYNMCSWVTQNRLLKRAPNFVMGYFVASMCPSMLLWNSEDPEYSAEILKKGRNVQSKKDIKLSKHEESYYKAAEALNAVNATSTECPEAGQKQTQPCRFRGFADAMQELFARYPDDTNAAAYVVLSQIALGSVTCKSFKPGACSSLDLARNVSHQLFNEGSANPALLHYGLHAHDYPFKDIYKAGLEFAVKYPQMVNGTCHSLHMSSHIYQRNGDWSSAAAADRLSVLAADKFSTMGGLAYQGGEIGTVEPPYTPGKTGFVSGLGFEFDAGNLYHSLEYEQSEVLQGCNRPRAVALTDRMAVAAFQAMAAGGFRTAEVVPADGDAVANLDSAWYYASTMNGWLYRMQARLSQQATISRMLGGVGPMEEAQLIVPLPLPLPWSGSSQYNNQVYAPQSEAGLWNAIALERLLGGGADALFSQLGPEPGSKPGPASKHDVWASACSSSGGALPGCSSTIAAMALQRIEEATKHYRTMGTTYEAMLNEVIGLQVRAAQALSDGQPELAVNLSQEASDLEVEAVAFINPSSISLYFLPGTAFNGAMAYRLSSSSWASATGKAEQLLQAAGDSFEACLAPTGRPNLAACSLGLARVKIAQQDPVKAEAGYRDLLETYGAEEGGKPARGWCGEAHAEAQEFLKSGNR